jgi:hypothetical protein
MGIFDALKKNELTLIEDQKKQIDDKLSIIEDQKKQIDDASDLISKLSIEITQLKLKYNGIEDVESARNEYLKELEVLKQSSNEELVSLRSKCKVLDEDYQKALGLYTQLKNETAILESKLEYVDFGIYEPLYAFEKSDEYREEQKRIIQKQKELISADAAAICHTRWTVEGSIAKGRIMTNKNKKLLLRAFNGECDAQISKVKWNNYAVISERIDKTYERLNKLSESDHIYISKEYFKLKKEELQLEYEYQQKKYQEKEEARIINEERREEEKALRDYEKARRDAERDELYYSKALKKVQQEIENATGAKYESLLEKISYLEVELKEAIENKERAISMAQQTRRGYVYVISNIGSFGENIYKIGMTRRLDPVDRIRELSNASVPFKYDIHAMILSEDAPSLEYKLHAAFDKNKVNLINGRKEFFNVTLNEIEQKVKEEGVEIEFTFIPEARDYRESISIKEIKSNPNSTDENIQNQINTQFPKSLFLIEDQDGNF